MSVCEWWCLGLDTKRGALREAWTVEAGHVGSEASEGKEASGSGRTPDWMMADPQPVSPPASEGDAKKVFMSSSVSLYRLFDDRAFEEHPQQSPQPTTPHQASDSGSSADASGQEVDEETGGLPVIQKGAIRAEAGSLKPRVRLNAQTKEEELVSSPGAEAGATLEKDATSSEGVAKQNEVAGVSSTPASTQAEEAKRSAAASGSSKNSVSAATPSLAEVEHSHAEHFERTESAKSETKSQDSVPRSRTSQTSEGRRMKVPPGTSHVKGKPPQVHFVQQPSGGAAPSVRPPQVRGTSGAGNPPVNRPQVRPPQVRPPSRSSSGPGANTANGSKPARSGDASLQEVAGGQVRPLSERKTQDLGTPEPTKSQDGGPVGKRLTQKLLPRRSGADNNPVKSVSAPGKSREHHSPKGLGSDMDELFTQDLNYITSSMEKRSSRESAKEFGTNNDISEYPSFDRSKSSELDNRSHSEQTKTKAWKMSKNDSSEKAKYSGAPVHAESDSVENGPASPLDGVSLKLRNTGLRKATQRLPNTSK
ncbi:hypothetical protein FVE85_7036 [Porphyridium purpureum]|uniref:Uncharacterized protein n=1 Tax=Porphyridium purpureum TaxID=35688 RepID=A0A5J4Z6G5_PORPP|nr:hypothetical protein FVE85_7036 [Porphyridium purpureum]|eukprot:POR3905..scf295_1